MDDTHPFIPGKIRGNHAVRLSTNVAADALGFAHQLRTMQQDIAGSAGNITRAAAAAEDLANVPLISARRRFHQAEALILQAMGELIASAGEIEDFRLRYGGTAWDARKVAGLESDDDDDAPEILN